MIEDRRNHFDREFYHLLIRMREYEGGVRPLLAEALKLILEVAGATKGYLDVLSEDGSRIYESWRLPKEEVENFQKQISSGIIAEAIRTSEPLMIPSAMLDPRFNANESVKINEIESVLCVPFSGLKSSGVLYLQGSNALSNLDKEIRDDIELFSNQLAPMLDRLLTERDRIHQTNRSLWGQYSLKKIVPSANRAFTELLREAIMIAPLQVPVLLLGETGTGKSLFANSIHENSNRANSTYVELNCAAIPDGLFESELFGTRKGGHGTATRDIVGKVQAAEGGTLFLDEIGELSLTAQAKVLHFIQNSRYYQLGSSTQMVADCRLIFATNKDLNKEVARGNFRTDLLHRISAFEITLPPLRHRKDDIRALAETFVTLAVSKHGLSKIQLTESAADQLVNQNWPGNVRQLQNVIERACIKCFIENQNAITESSLEHITESAKTNPETPETGSYQTSTTNFQKALLRKTLDDCDWNISAAAKKLELSRSYVHHLMNSFNISRET